MSAGQTPECSTRLVKGIASFPPTLAPQAPPTIAEMLRTHSVDWTYKRLAKESGLSARTIGNALTYRDSMTTKTLETICRALGLVIKIERRP